MAAKRKKAAGWEPPLWGDLKFLDVEGDSAPRELAVFLISLTPERAKGF